MIAPNDSGIPRRIKKLDDDVIAKIAAGEVVVRPVSVVKELLENCLDSGATTISITVKEGGLRQIRIQDDGSGIGKNDLPHVCERHTTSKLHSFADFKYLGSFGFRGEALASVSCSAHVTITSRTKESPCAYRLSYRTSVAATPARPAPGSIGTLIDVDDLFYNNTLRRSTMGTATDEFNRISDVVMRYAIHNPTVALSLRRQESQQVNFRSAGGAQADRLAVIDSVTASSVSQHLVAMSWESVRLRANADMLFSELTYTQARRCYIFFVNGRLVNVPAMARLIDQQFAQHLLKGSHPFAYVSITLEPCLIDVNVHPSKSEVHFLHEDVIITTLMEYVMGKLSERSADGANLVQNKMPQYLGMTTMAAPQDPAKRAPSAALPDVANPQKKVRSDYRERTIDSFIVPPPIAQQSMHLEGADAGKRSVSFGHTPERKRPRRHIELTSVGTLLERVCSESDPLLRDIFNKHIYVGAANERTAFLQHETRLYSVDIGIVRRELFYQLLLENVGNVGQIVLQPAPSLMEICIETLRQHPNDLADASVDTDPIVQAASGAVDLLMSAGELLADYYCLQFTTDARLHSIPELLPRHCPQLRDIGVWLLRLAGETKGLSASERNSESELPFFESFSRITAEYYAGCDSSNSEAEARESARTILDAARKHMRPSRKVFGDSGALRLLTSVEELYRVFERC